MTVFSGVLPVTATSQNVAACGVGQEVTVFGLVFVNATTALKSVTLSLYRQATASTQTMVIELAPKERWAWPKPIMLQPSDHLEVFADAVGASLLWSVDQDTGTNPVATGFTIRGAWNSATPYAANDVVLNGGSSWGALRASTNVVPNGTNTADWMILVDGSGIAAYAVSVIGGAPANMDTLGEISASLGNDPAFATTMTAALAAKVPTSCQFTGAGLATGGGDHTANRVITVPAAAASDILVGTSTVKSVTPAALRGAGAFATLTDASTVAWDTATQGFNASVTFTANRTVGAPTGLQDGDVLTFEPIQGTGGSFAPSWNAIWEWGAALAPTLQTAATKADLVTAIYRSRTGKLHATFRKGA